MIPADECPNYFTRESSVALAVLNGISGVLSVVGNALVLTAIYRKHYLHTVSNFFIGSLATADLTVGLLMNPLNIVMNVVQAWADFNSVWMKMQSFLWITTTTTTTFSLMAVTVDRFLAISMAFRYKNAVTTTRCLFVIVFNWAFAVFFGSMTFWIPGEQMTRLWIACAFVTVVLPLTVIIFCYVRMCKVAFYHTRRIASLHHDQSAPTQRQVNQGRQTKAAWTAGLVIMVFVFLFSPSFVINCLQIINTDFCRMSYYQSIWAWVSFISYTSSPVNPWIYAIRSHEYRAAFKSIFGRDSLGDSRFGSVLGNQAVLERNTLAFNDSHGISQPTSRVNLSATAHARQPPPV